MLYSSSFFADVFIFLLVIMKNIFGFFCLFFLFFFGVVAAEEWNLEGVQLIKRAERGADERIRYKDTYGDQSNPDTSREPKDSDRTHAEVAAVRSAYMKANFPNDWRYDRTSNVLDGHLLLRPDQINRRKTKIIIHHTATAYDQSWGREDIHRSLQQIYRYHTLDRDFGDIGYNFLIDHLGNVYEGRAGGAGAAGMHASYNNVATLGISLLGNFEQYSPTQAQINALTNLLTALSKKYRIDPLGSQFYFQPTKTSPYIVAKKLPTIVGHKDVSPTACPGTLLFPLLPALRTEVHNRLAGKAPQEVHASRIVPQSFVHEEPGFIALDSGSHHHHHPHQPASSSVVVGDKGFVQKLQRLQEQSPQLFSQVLSLVRERYSGSRPQTTHSFPKVSHMISVEEAKRLLTQDISVLLYELTTNYKEFHLACDTTCQFYVNGKLYETPNLVLRVVSREGGAAPLLQLFLESQYLTIPEVRIGDAQGKMVHITNYDRSSYAGIPWNVFRGQLVFSPDVYVQQDGVHQRAMLVMNQLSFTDYLKGIVEANDQESLEKNKVMALVAKNYALFYLEGKNIHPSIPEGAKFQAIDSPEMFQKYAGAGVERTLKKWSQALEATKNVLVMYDQQVPILPYFSCSAGFTWSAEEKRGRNDTPWLRSVYDFVGCKKFAGHGVGLAGQGAEWLAQQGMSAEAILSWYYPGVKLVTF